MPAARTRGDQGTVRRSAPRRGARAGAGARAGRTQGPRGPRIAAPHPGPRSREILAKVHRLESPATCSFVLTDEIVVEESGRGAYVRDPDGNEFLDFTSGFGVLSLGHSPAPVKRAARAQLDRLLHAMGAVAAVRAPLYELLARVTPGDMPKRIQLAASGAEAVDVSLKIAKRFTGRSEVISFLGAFHGRTHSALALMSKPHYRAGVLPLVPGVVQFPYAYCYRCYFGLTYPGCDLRCARNLESSLHPDAGWVTEPAALIVEPIQGNGGIVVPPPEFLPELRAACARHGILFIADEIMTGWCRTGELFAINHGGVVPDILVLGKALAAGLPLSAVVARAELMESWDHGRDGSTSAGNPISCAAALAAVPLYVGGGLAGRAARLGARLMSGLSALAEEFPFIGEVRGRGLMVGVELVRDRATREPWEAAPAVVDAACKRGLLLYYGGRYDNVVGFLPPLIIGNHEVDTALDVVGQVFRLMKRELDRGRG
ncbi:MAG: aspartate aminotransferase family protein [Acetobacteraceae bacterium]|nr:aspartate aminotransferase family protein [Acetobacteraceae bacterium]